MDTLRAVVFPAMYRDSAFLMQLSSQACEQSGARQVSAMMATRRNKELLAASGLMTPDIAGARPGDLVVAIDADAATGAAAEQAVRSLLRPAGASFASPHFVPKSLRRAVDIQPDSDLAIVSAPGEYARYVAAEAVAAGLDVMLYSDNIGLEDEIALKRLARQRGRLIMGPDCGTAIIDRVPLGFANRVRPGFIGIVAGSGTGIQETACLLDRVGLGISAAYGTGRRDFSDAVGGVSAAMALDRLAGDPGTRLVLVIAHQPGDATRRRLCDHYRRLGKQVIVRYLGVDDYAAEDDAGVGHADTLSDLAVTAARVIAPELDVSDLDLPSMPPAGGEPLPGWITGLFSGGTLCEESAEQIARILPEPVRTNTGFGPADAPAARCHWCIDMGADDYTVGRPHPLLNPRQKLDRVVDALCDDRTGLVLTDIVLGAGTCDRQAALLVQAVDEAAARTEGRSRQKPVVVSVCGTETDMPSRSSQIDILGRSSIIVLGNAVAAARYAASLMEGRPCG